MNIITASNNNNKLPRTYPSRAGGTRNTSSFPTEVPCRGNINRCFNLHLITRVIVGGAVALHFYLFVCFFLCHSQQIRFYLLLFFLVHKQSLFPLHHGTFIFKYVYYKPLYAKSWMVYLFISQKKRTLNLYLFQLLDIGLLSMRTSAMKVCRLYTVKCVAPYVPHVRV